MAQKKQTTVNLLASAQIVKEDLAPVYGLKNILSAGLILFGRLTDTEQKRLLKTVNESEPTGAAADESGAAQVGLKKQRKGMVRDSVKAGWFPGFDALFQSL